MSNASPEELMNAVQVQGPVLPIVREKPTVDIVTVTDELKANKAYSKLCLERMNERLISVRKKRVEAEKEEKK